MAPALRRQATLASAGSFPVRGFCGLFCTTFWSIFGITQSIFSPSYALRAPLPPRRWPKNALRSGSSIGKGRPLPHADAVSAKNARLEISGNWAENSEGFRGALNEGKGAASG
jgi:hypothetical protein